MVALCLTAGAATAAITLRATPSTLTTSAAPPPFTFAAGAQSTDAVHVTAFSLSANRTSFDARVRGVPQATIMLPQLCTLTNRLASAQTLTITAGPVTSAAITAFKLEFRAPSGTLLGTLDLRAAAPSTTFTLAANQVVDVRATLALAEGAGNHNVNANATLRVTSPG